MFLRSSHPLVLTMYTQVDTQWGFGDVFDTCPTLVHTIQLGIYMYLHVFIIVGQVPTLMAKNLWLQWLLCIFHN